MKSPQTRANLIVMHFSRFLFFSIAATLCHPLCRLAGCKKVQSELIISRAAQRLHLAGDSRPAARFARSAKRPLAGNSRARRRPAAHLRRTTRSAKAPSPNSTATRRRAVSRYDRHLTADEWWITTTRRKWPPRTATSTSRQRRATKICTPSGAPTTWRRPPDSSTWCTARSGAHIGGKKLALTNTNPFFFSKRRKWIA